MRAGMLAGGLLPGAQRLDEHHRLALVVHRAARDEALAVRAIDQLRLERRAVPELQRIDRLHVVMAIEQDVRPLIAGGSRMMRDHHGMARGRPHFGAKPEAGELVAHPFGGAQAVLPVVRLRADRGDAQQIEQPSARGVQRCIDMAQHAGDSVRQWDGHRGFSAEERGRRLPRG